MLWYPPSFNLFPTKIKQLGSSEAGKELKKAVLAQMRAVWRPWALNEVPKGTKQGPTGLSQCNPLYFTHFPPRTSNLGPWRSFKPEEKKNHNFESTVSRKTAILERSPQIKKNQENEPLLTFKNTYKKSVSQGGPLVFGTLTSFSASPIVHVEVWAGVVYST